MTIKKITREQFSGKVFNIGVATDHTYFAEGILVHNCRSILIPVTQYEKDTLSEVEDVPDRSDLQDMGASLL